MGGSYGGDAPDVAFEKISDVCAIIIPAGEFVVPRIRD